ncbi:MAG: hypothetical protein RSC06_04005, partial [Clostridia bacterium]
MNRASATGAKCAKEKIMTTQKLSAKQVTPLQGILLIAGIVATMFLMSVAGRLLRGYVPLVWVQLGVVALAALAAFYLMRHVIVEYQYTVADDSFFIERLYGRRSKIMLQIPLADALYLGTREAALEKWPGSRMNCNAIVRGVALPVKTLAYRKGGEMLLAQIQPDPALTKALFDLEKRKQKAEDKWG